MNRSSRASGFTLTEMILICALTCILLGITGIAWQRASANRKADAAISELESALTLARQTAQNRNGSYISFTPPTENADGYWELFPGARTTSASKQTAIAKGAFPRVLTVTLIPASLKHIDFNTAGSIDSKLTPLNSENNCVIKIAIGGDERETTLTIVGMTGAVVKTIGNKSSSSTNSTGSTSNLEPVTSSTINNDSFD